MCYKKTSIGGMGISFDISWDVVDYHQYLSFTRLSLTYSHTHTHTRARIHSIHFVSSTLSSVFFNLFFPNVGTLSTRSRPSPLFYYVRIMMKYTCIAYKVYHRQSLIYPWRIAIYLYFSILYSFILFFPFFFSKKKRIYSEGCGMSAYGQNGALARCEAAEPKVNYESTVFLRATIIAPNYI